MFNGGDVVLPFNLSNWPGNNKIENDLEIHWLFGNSQNWLGTIKIENDLEIH
jgi:hypothetical protein